MQDLIKKQSVALFGASGSIGASTLSVIEQNSERFELFAVTANRNVESLLAICIKHQPQFAVMVDAAAAVQLSDELKKKDCTTKVLAGEAELVAIAAAHEVDTVVAAIVGAAGLSSCFAAAKAGKRILLANKESVVIAGQFLLDVAHQNNAEIIPLDSEHNAIFQCHPLAQQKGQVGQNPNSVSKIFLTASGGPFLQRELQSFASITPDEACAHPRWSMGRKISVDSATMMNKGLELIEASVLFGLKPDKIEVVIHPQSIVHSMVEYIDGSVLAQLGTADMRVPIAHALGFPERIQSGAKRLSIMDLQQLEFSVPCKERFPALQLAKDAADEAKVLPVVMNAANEIAVASFLDGKLDFPAISALVKQQMSTFATEKVDSLADVMELDHAVRVASLSSI